ncbi:hypothetical protein LJC31_01215 [Synergistaceae bacterium OttesenSCG-928-I11]|nr:hypothetical protein [Synergistaceae bacterium OttesenSCG-928-I11]
MTIGTLRGLDFFCRPFEPPLSLTAFTLYTSRMRLSKKFPAFTLVETILCLVLTVVLLGGIPHAVYLCQLALHAMSDAHAAQNRAEQVRAIIRPMVETCGYGVSKDPDDFRAAFELGGLAPFNWPGPISVVDGAAGTSGREASTCRIVYAIPSGIRTTQETRTTEDTFQVRVSATPGNLESHSTMPHSTKNWALFAAATPRFHPAWLTATSGTGPDGALLLLRRRGNGELLIPRNDELFYLRAAEIQVRAYDDGTNRDDFALYTNDHTGSGWQPRVVGVVDARFELADERRLLRVVMLVRGEKRYDRDVTTGTPDGWPAKWADDIPQSARRYRLYAHSVAFNLKNF